MAAKKFLCRIRHTVQKMKLSVKNFFSKCEQIRNFLRICSHLLKKSTVESFIFSTMFFLENVLRTLAFTSYSFAHIIPEDR